MAATDQALRGGAILAAALALPGLGLAESAPEQGQVAIKLLNYQDQQPGLKRIKVTAPSLQVLAPLGSAWSLEANAVSDHVSGASPKYHTAISGASVMHDERHALDAKLTRYNERSSWGLSLGNSTENDYKSQTVALDAAFTSEDGNRTWNVGLGNNNDKIGSTNNLALHEKRRTTELLAGVTQALTQTDLVQLNLSVTRGSGFFSDPYKALDARPRERNQTALLARWNHHFSDWGATLRASYRYYTDNWGIHAHTVGAEWVQPVSAMFTLTPSLRVYSQTAANFYFDPVYDPDIGAPYPVGYFSNTPTTSSADQRLSAFGALTAGLTATARFDALWSGDLKLERYEQRSSWKIGGKGSPGLAPFTANIVQLGLARKF